MVRNWSLAAWVILLLLAAGCDSDHSRIVVSADGRIGRLHVDRSDRAVVIAFAGRPDAEKRGRGRAPFDALGYDCGKKPSDRTYPLVMNPEGPPFCRTVFWIDVPSGKLENFFTADSRYVEAHGVRIGMPTAITERLLHKRLFAGCGTNLGLGQLTIAFTGGATQRKTGHVIGGHVFAFVLHSRIRDAYVFDCM